MRRFRISGAGARGWAVVLCLSLLMAQISMAAPAHAETIEVSPLDGADLAPVAASQQAGGALAREAASAPIAQQFQEKSYHFKDLAFANENMGLAVGAPHWDDALKAFRGTIVKTTDGGLSWQEMNAGEAPTLLSVSFPDPQHAWAVGEEGVILSTIDGGASWARQNIATDDELLAVAFADAQRGWIGAMKPVHFRWNGEADDWRATVWRTTDGGATWMKANLPADAALIQDIDALDVNQAWGVGIRTYTNQYGGPDHYPAVYKTADGGATWQLAYSPQIAISLTAVDFIDPLHGWVTGFPFFSNVTGGATYRTTDGGQTWERQKPGDGIYYPIWDIKFINTQQGYAVGFDYMSAWGAPVWRTLDGGTTWTKVRMARHNNEGLFGVGVAGGHVVAVGDHDYVARSDQPWAACAESDCAGLFTQRFLNTHYTFYDVDFVGPTQGWAVGSKSVSVETRAQVIFHTADGGTNWAEQFAHNPPPNDAWTYHRLEAVDMVDAQVGWAVGAAEQWYEQGWRSHGAIWRTTDGGTHWTEQGTALFKDTIPEFSAVQALSANEAWALLESGGGMGDHVVLAHTTDGGANWQWVDTGIAASVAVGFGIPQGALKFTDAQHGWVGAWNAVLRTEDGGAHWSKLPLVCEGSLCYPSSQAIDFAGPRGWLAGERMWRSDDRVTWTSTSIVPHADRGASVDFYDLQFLNAKDGWAAGNSGALLYTANAGDNWGRMPYATGYDLNGIAFLQPTEGWAVGDAGVILKVDLPQFPPTREVYLPLLGK